MTVNLLLPTLHIKTSGWDVKGLWFFSNSWLAVGGRQASGLGIVSLWNFGTAASLASSGQHCCGGA